MAGQMPSTDPPARVPRRYVGHAGSTSPPEEKPRYKPDRAWDKLLFVVGAVVVALALFVVPGILNQGGKNPIAAAAEATRNAPGVRMTFQMSGQAPVPMTMTGSGVMNGETQRMWMEFKANGAGRQFSFTEVLDDTDLYMRMPEITEQLGGGKSWMLIRAESFFGDLYQGGSSSLGAGMSASPAQQLEQLESASDDVMVAGQEQVDGVQTIHYTAVLDIQKILDDLRSHSGELADLVEKTLAGTDGTDTVNVWVDDQGLVRRMQSSMAMGSLGSFTMTIDFSDYGIHPKIDVPPESEVFDATPLLDRFLSGSESLN